MNTLYYNPYSQHSRRVIALLEAAGLSYQKQLVALDKGEHLSAEFITLNPNHQVPVLQTDELVLLESNAILRYLAQKYALKDWYPEDAVLRAKIDQWLDWNQCQLAQAVINIVINSVFLGDKGDPVAIQSGNEKVKELTPILEAALKGQSYITGEKPSLADLSIGSNLTQLTLAKALPQSELIQTWYQRLCELEGFKKALPENLMAVA